MGSEEKSTLDQILAAGEKEFLAKGFRTASLRTIVKEAGVTTGAFYGYFKSKEELFEALVGEAATVFLARFGEAQNTFRALPPEEQPSNMGEISSKCMEWMVEYIYDHFTAFKLLICFAEGTRFEGFLHTMVEIETEATHRFLHVLEGLGHPVRPIDGQLEHILVSGLFSGFFETVRHDMPREKARQYTRELREFYEAGWKKIMGL